MSRNMKPDDDTFWADPSFPGGRTPTILMTVAWCLWRSHNDGWGEINFSKNLIDCLSHVKEED